MNQNSYNNGNNNGYGPPPVPPSSIDPRDQLPKTYLVEALLCTFFCCLPLGIISIINASKVEGAYYAGYHDLARQYSEKAKKWALWSLLAAIGFWILYILFFVVVFLVIGVGSSEIFDNI